MKFLKKKDGTEAVLVAYSVEDVDTLQKVFNEKLIYGAYLLWIKKNEDKTDERVRRFPNSESVLGYLLINL